VPLPNTRHGQMDDYGKWWQRKEIADLVTGFLADYL